MVQQGGGGGGRTPFPDQFYISAMGPRGVPIDLQFNCTSQRTYESNGQQMGAAMYEETSFGWEFGLAVNLYTTNVEEIAGRLLSALAVTGMRALVEPGEEMSLKGGGEDLGKGGEPEPKFIGGGGTPPPPPSDPVYMWPATKALMVGNDGSARPRGEAGALRLLKASQYGSTTVSAPAFGSFAPPPMN